MVLVVGCDASSDLVIDSFPIGIDMTHARVPLVRGCSANLGNCDDGSEPWRLVIDTGSPLTLIDPDAAVEAVLRRRALTLDLEAPAPGGTGYVPRARFTLVSLLGDVGGVGLAAADVEGVVGGDVLTKVAVRLDAQGGTLRLLPDVAGESDAHARACDAVVPITLAGGGEVELPDGTSSEFPATRTIVGACVEPDGPDAASLTDWPNGGGADTLLVVATGVEITVLSRSAYVRAKLVDDVDTLPTGFLSLPGSAGLTAVRLGSVNRLAVAADEAENRGPCRELLGSRVMELDGCNSDRGACHCTAGTLECPAGASLELVGPLQVAVIEDTDPLLQGLRAELRPRVADVDGLLGMNALLPLLADFDYPGGRLIFRCRDAADPTCVARPRIGRLEQIAETGELYGCRSAEPWFDRSAGVP